jgi:glycosyltransferase involved in cell wall biosynthesis
MPKLSVTIIAQDEEDRIGAALDAIRCADEILVVDGGSRDGTVEMCRARGCRVLTRPFDDFGRQKRFAAEQASHDWVLNLDADEVMSPELNEEIRHLMAGAEIHEAAFRVPMRFVFMGRAFAHGRHSREYHVRLFDRRRASYDGREVHEGIVARGPVADLRALLLHDSYRDVTHAIQKMNDYTSHAAGALARRGRRRAPALVALSAPFYFAEAYLLRGNAWNGVPGLWWSMLYAFYPLVKYMKAWEASRPR